jgi:hypothetical protein
MINMERRHIDAVDSVQVGGTHYKDMPIQPWDLMEVLLTHEEFVGFLRGNIIKYSMRAGRKEGASDDADKARHYMWKLKEIQGDDIFEQALGPCGK